MLIAKLQENGNYLVQDHTEMFPTVSNINDDYLTEQGCVKVNLFLDHDRATQKLESCQPYLQDGWVYTVKVEPLTEDELAAIAKTEAVKANAVIYAQIATIEAKQPRAIREAMLSMDGAMERLLDIEDQIADLRKQLVIIS